MSDTFKVLGKTFAWGHSKHPEAEAGPFMQLWLSTDSVSVDIDAFKNHWWFCVG